MRVKEIRTKGLFGIFDHVIPLNLEDRITIIHGPNGFGKTSILRMVAGVFGKKFSVLRPLPFQAFEIEFDDGNTLSIKRQLSSWKHRGSSTIRTTVEFDSQKHFEVSMPEILRDCLYERCADLYPPVQRIAEEQWVQRDSDEVLDTEEFIERYGRHFQDLPELATATKPFPRWFGELVGLLDIHFIRTNRVEDIRPRSVDMHGERISKTEALEHFVVEDVVRKITQHIGRASERYSELSQSLDQSLPHRLLSGFQVQNGSQDDLLSKLRKLDERRRELTVAGLLDKQAASQIDLATSIPEKKIHREVAPVLSMFIDDSFEKLAVFNSLYERIQLLQQILNRRFLYKKVSVDKHEGLIFRSDNDQVLPVSCLSTGEQHELVLLYRLLFEVKEDSLILIDEPEMSLHVSWQLQFLEDLSRIANLVKFDVLLATHSPQIINDRWDLTVELKGPVNCENT